MNSQLVTMQGLFACTYLLLLQQNTSALKMYQAVGIILVVNQYIFFIFMSLVLSALSIDPLLCLQFSLFCAAAIQFNPDTLLILLYQSMIGLCIALPPSNEEFR